MVAVPETGARFLCVLPLLVFLVSFSFKPWSALAQEGDRELARLPAADITALHNNKITKLGLVDMPSGCTCQDPVLVAQARGGVPCHAFDCPCQCDVTPGICDVNCCCDRDCSDGERGQFSSRCSNTREVDIPMEDEPLLHCHNRGQTTSPLVDIAVESRSIDDTTEASPVMC
jgi:hypothetical protein